MSEITINNLTKTYGDVMALNDISLSVPRESSLGLLGTNGAGKTTLFKLMIGHERPDSGTLNVAGLSPEHGVAVRQRVGYVPEDSGFPESFTGREILDFHADIRGVTRNEKQGQINEALERVGLTEASDRPVGGYSKGMNRRLGLATVLLGDPRVLLLDEPTSGLDPRGMKAFHEVLERFRKDSQVTLVISSHILSEIDRLCDRVAVLDKGRLKASGRIDDLREASVDTVDVEIRVSDSDTVSRGLDELQTKSIIESMNQVDSSRVRLECSEEAVFEVLELVRTQFSVEGLEIRTHGIADVFERAIDDSHMASTGREEDSA